MIVIVILVHATRARPDLEVDAESPGRDLRTRSHTSGAGRSHVLHTPYNIRHHLVGLELPVRLLPLFSSFTQSYILLVDGNFHESLASIGGDSQA